MSALGRLAREENSLATLVVVAALLHVAVALSLPRTRPLAVTRAPAVVTSVDVVVPPPPPPPPAPPPTVEEHAPAAPAPAPAPAQAAKILAQAPAADAPADLTGAFVTGEAATYAGGMTATNGTSPRAVRNVVASAPGPSGTSGVAGVVKGTEDLSRRPAIEGDGTWKCPFPAEADGINEAAVLIRVRVDARGKLLESSVTRDPGHGFGREALACVRDKRWTAAADRDGNPVEAGVTMNVRFVR